MSVGMRQPNYRKDGKGVRRALINRKNAVRAGFLFRFYYDDGCIRIRKLETEAGPNSLISNVRHFGSEQIKLKPGSNSEAQGTRGRIIKLETDLPSHDVQ